MSAVEDRKKWEADVLHHVLSHAPTQTTHDPTPDWISAISTAMVETRAPAEQPPTLYHDPIPEHTKRRLCWLRLRRHVWSEPFERGMHRYKICLNCGRRPITHHLSCPAACWAGPA